jgi:carbon-monoxide dehydrogenase medium subunit
LKPFEYLEPASLGDAVRLLDPDDTSVRPVGGATAMMLMMKAGVLQPKRLVSLRNVEPKYSRIEVAADGHLRIGALATLSQIERSPRVRKDWPLLAQALLTLANVRVRNVATIGGHLAHADPHMDLPPVLSALGASLTVVGPAAERTVAVEALCTGYYETVLRRDELIAEIRVPPQAGRPGAYLKCTTRSADDWPALGITTVLEVKQSRFTAASVLVSAATDRPTRLRAAESILKGSRVDDATLRKAGEAAAAEIDIVGDAHGSASYKKSLLRIGLGRAVRAALAGTASEGLDRS